MDATQPPISDTATARAYRALEGMIVTLALEPGSVLTEGALIDRVGLGRTPVREAIQRLAWEGLIEVRPRAGIAIAALQAADWPRVIEARLGVEIILARTAARFITPRLAESFRQAAVMMGNAAAGDDVPAFLEADKALDESLAAASDNPFAARLAAPLQTHSRRFWFRYQADKGLNESAKRHMWVIRAILNGDEDAAIQETENLMSMLLDNARVAARR